MSRNDGPHSPPDESRNAHLDYRGLEDKRKSGWAFKLILGFAGAVLGFFVSAMVGISVYGDQGPLVTLFTLWPIIIFLCVFVGHEIDRRRSRNAWLIPFTK